VVAEQAGSAIFTETFAPQDAPEHSPFEQLPTQAPVVFQTPAWHVCVELPAQRIAPLVHAVGAALQTPLLHMPPVAHGASPDHAEPSARQVSTDPLSAEQRRLSGVQTGTAQAAIPAVSALQPLAAQVWVCTKPLPSEAQVCTALPEHCVAPGVQASWTQAPFTQPCGQVVLLAIPLPSALQVWRLLPLQPFVPGVQASARQAPPLQRVPAAHVVPVLQCEPSELQVCTVPSLPQRTESGLQASWRQVFVAESQP
jgi:hypothetical protein